MIQSGSMNWFAENVLLSVLIIFIVLVVILGIYLKLQVHVIYEGTIYRHYRKGRLLLESDKGGMIFLLPFFDKLEIIPPTEPTSEDTTDYFDDKEFE